MPDWNGALIQLHNWIAASSATLRAISFLLGGFSLVFGGKILGRFLNLTKSGGFYSSVLFAVPTAACYAALIFAEDAFTHRIYSRLYSNVFHYAFTTESLAILTGIATLVFSIANPNVYRTQGETRPYTVGGVTMLLISFCTSGFLLLLLVAYYLFAILKWFGGTPPPPWVLAVYGAAYGASLTWLVVSQAKMRSANNEGDRTPVLGCLIAALLGIPLYAATLVFTGSLVLRLGWIMIIFIVIGVILGWLIALFRFIADHLDRARLLQIFAIPGVIAVALQFVINNDNLLPH
ncbi:MAG TPA: hypothetical protein VGR57_09045 [Ktedonobacterales bacterium]|nr:hypothetical protein [Ktedonobacterales bacterium]